MNNAISGIKNTLEATNSRITEAEDIRHPEKQPNSSKGERRNTAPPTRTPTQASLIRKP